MILAHKIALATNPAQGQAFARSAGCARFTWNWALAEWKAQYQAGEKPTAAQLKKKFNAMKGEQFPWIYESPKDANQQVFSQLNDAFQRFFKKQSQYPKFKKKGVSHDSFYVSNDKFDVQGNRIKLPKIGWVKMREALRFNGKMISATVSRTADRWFVAIHVEVEPHAAPCETQAGRVGIDLGVNHLATPSKGDPVEGPKPLRQLIRKLQRLSRQLSRKVKGSHNRRKAVDRLARLHARIANVRQDAMHKLTTQLCWEFDEVVIEDLHVKGMVRNRKLARAISDMGLGMFRQQMTYKSALYGVELIIADRWFPSSKMCRICGVINEHLTLADRVFACEACGHSEDRDEHAARNLERYPGLQGEPNACGLPSAGLMLQPSGETQQVEAGIQSVQLGLFGH